MTLDLQTVFTILGMAIVTYLSRAGGFWLVSRVTMTPALGRALRALPGTILISIVAPSIFSGGPREGIAALVTTVVAWFSKSLLLAMIVGVSSVWLLRHIPM